MNEPESRKHKRLIQEKLDKLIVLLENINLVVATAAPAVPGICTCHLPEEAGKYCSIHGYEKDGT